MSGIEDFSRDDAINFAILMGAHGNDGVKSTKGWTEGRIRDLLAALQMELDVETLMLHTIAWGPLDNHSIATTVARATTRIDRLLRFRIGDPAGFEKKRIDGMKRSELVRQNLQRIHRESKDAWKASALKNPRLRATDQHVAAKDYTLRSPSGEKYTFRNLKKWVRDHADLFDAGDVDWKEPEGKPNQAWCTAFHRLGRLRPGRANHLNEWNGWEWGGE